MTKFDQIWYFLHIWYIFATAENPFFRPCLKVMIHVNCTRIQRGGGRSQQKYAATLAVGERKSTEIGLYETISITVQNSTERPWKRGRFNRLPSFGQREELSFVPPCLVLTKGPGITFVIICDFLFDIQNNAWLVLYFISLLILVICGSTLECSRLEVKFLHFYERIAKNDL